MLYTNLQKNLGITHPLIKNAYFKKDCTTNKNKEEDVLVLETYHHSKKSSEYETFDTYMIDLLTDLQDLKDQAEAKIGHIDRIDICQH